MAHQVTIEVPDMNGGYRPITGTKEIVFGEIEDNNQTKEMLKHKRAHCETKALLRALRSAMMLNSGYNKEDFEKPFIVAIIVPNTDNEQVKKIMLEKMAHTSGLLFGSNDEPLQIGNTDFDDDSESVEIIQDDDDLPEIFKDHFCEECGQEITDTTKRTAQEFINFSLENYDVELCNLCINKRAKKA